MNGPICLCSAIMGVCMGFRVSEKSKGEQTCNQKFLILSLLYSSPVSYSLFSHFYLFALPLLTFPPSSSLLISNLCSSLSFYISPPALTSSDSNHVFFFLVFFFGLVYVKVELSYITFHQVSSPVFSCR